jgi:hypothetical protein
MTTNQISSNSKMDMEGIVIVMEFGLESWLADGRFGILGFDMKEGWPGAMA